MAIYRERFEPSPQLPHPYVIAGMNVIAADTVEEAERDLEPSSLCQPLGLLLGPRRLVGEDQDHRRDGEGAVWLEAEHDGWVHDFGLLHQRRLYLDQRLDEVRAEERLHPAPGRSPAPACSPSGRQRSPARLYRVTPASSPGRIFYNAYTLWQCLNTTRYSKAR